mgnify:CR=1 FL=1
MLKPIIPLSSREEAHFKLMLEGVSPKEIAEMFDIQPITVKKRVAKILEKYDMPNTLKLVCAYYKSITKI